MPADRPLQHAKPLVALVRRGRKLGAGADLGREKLRDHDDADDPFVGVEDGHGRAQERAAGARDPLSESPRRPTPPRARPVGRPTREARSFGSRGLRRVDERDIERPARLGHRPIDLDHAVAHRLRLVLDERCRARRSSPAATAAGRQHARQPLRAQRHLLLTFLVVLTRDRLRGAEHVVDRLAEPARGAVADDLAAADEHEHRRARSSSRAAPRRAWRETARTAPPAAARPRASADCARARNTSAAQQREVDGQQRVEQDVGQQRRRDLARSAGQPEQPGQDRDEQAGRRASARADCRAGAGAPPRRSGVGARVGRNNMGQRMNVKSARPDAVVARRTARARTCASDWPACARARSTRRSARAARGETSATRSNVVIHCRTCAIVLRALRPDDPAVRELRHLIHASQVVELHRRGHRDGRSV